MTLEDVVRAVSGFLFFGGWIVVAAFGLYIYLDIRGLSKDTVAARLFLHFRLFLRAFLLLGAGFAAFLAAIVPSVLRLPGSIYAALAGIVVWFLCIVLSFYWLFKSLHVPREIRRKYGKPAQR